MTAVGCERILIGMGSNVGDRRAHLRAAIRRLTEMPGITVERVSRLWQTLAWGGPEGQDDFLNAAVVVTGRDIDPRRLLRGLQAIEHERRRVRTVRFGPRTLDLDILLFGARVIEEEGLAVPHRGMHRRDFVLGPSAEIAGEMRHPILKRSLNELWADLGQDGIVEVHGEEDWFHAVGHSQSL